MNAPKFAATTSVPVDRTQSEIRRVLERYGATGFMFGQQGQIGAVMFEMANRRIKITVKCPKGDDQKSAQVTRSLWRTLLLVIKSKLECVNSGISTLEEEFMAFIVMPNGQTIGQIALPQIAESYTTGHMPPLLGGRGS